MKIKIIIVLVINFYVVCYAQGTKIEVKKDRTSNIGSDDNINDTIIETVLVKQLKQGTTQTIDEAGAGLSKIQFGIDELEATLQIADEVLKLNGFKALDTDNFNKKVKNVFGRIIDPKSKSIFLHVNFFDKCDRDFVMYNNNEIDYDGIFIEKQRKIILKFYYIPELIDYQKQYSKLNNIENTKIIRKSSIDNLEIEIPHWKDIPNLKDQRKKNIQTIVARNMYLFNDSRAYFKWLLLNDQSFMEKLVTNFGYYDDKELLKWVVENTKVDSNTPNELDKIFWNKKCDGTVKLNLEIFPVLKDIIKSNDIDYFEPLKEYVMYLLTNKEIRKELPLQDRAKLLAHLVYFGEQYRYDKNYNDKSYFMQRIWMRDIDDSVKKEIIRNNYYNLPDYKNLYEKSEEYQNALVDENGG
ncbi:hypothetical protein [[Flexibacter] sp. ATCC 35103]|uniref:hypothetical protein n=1 Tax=[Flexibacter] sp. ATCC 35103 TaxID=1937528 RepID=UPI0009C9752D|nr:hypothetical protein [[Flexibacter] sp. ATCC 35103]OMQ09511.1 hypothetical protein BXU01_17995 [[Flexibacter] sp. ATCC 35103]